MALVLKTNCSRQKFPKAFQAVSQTQPGARQAALDRAQRFAQGQSGLAVIHPLHIYQHHGGAEIIRQRFQAVLDRLAQMVLGGDAKTGDRVAFDAEGADLRVKVESAPPAAPAAGTGRDSVAK